jgi:hypothetical protein
MVVTAIGRKAVYSVRLFNEMSGVTKPKVKERR